MFTLLSGLWRYIFQKDEYYILILGLDNVGKTVCGYDFMYKFKILGLCFASYLFCRSWRFIHISIVYVARQIL